MRLLIKVVAGVFLLVLIAALAVVLHANYRISQDEVLENGANAPGRLLMVNGHQWHVRQLGKALDPTKPPLLAIHGFIVPGSQSLMPWLDSLATDRALILPDLLGYGYSERILESGPHFAAKNYAAGLANILDQLGVAQVDIVGHSYGGAIAARFALDYPDRVRRIVFMNSPIYYLEPSAGERIIELPLGIGRALAWHMMGSGPVSFSNQICQNKAATCTTPTRIKGTTDTVRAMMASHRGAADNESIVRDIGKIKNRSLVVWGEKDGIFPVDYGQRLAKGLNTRITIVPDARHTPFLGQPAATTKLVSDFFNTP
jgi:pimeloyl-ACP methyl ester carboxylesterase